MSSGLWWNISIRTNSTHGILAKQRFIDHDVRRQIMMATCRIPLVLLAYGSFNPITNQHMRLFELARDHMHSTGQFEVVGGIVSPVSDGYGKQGLVQAKHCIFMAKLALQSSNWVTVDEWESQQPDWTETVVTMRYHYSHILKEYEQRTGAHSGGHGNINISAPPPQLKLLCGADFLSTFKIPGLWLDDHVEELVSRFGLVCVSRRSLQPECAVHESDTLHRHRQNVFLVRDWVRNESSATEIRRALRRGQSVKYLILDGNLNNFCQPTGDIYQSWEQLQSFKAAVH